jgi:hypothetical protein
MSFCCGRPIPVTLSAAKGLERATLSGTGAGNAATLRHFFALALAGGATGMAAQ